MTHLYYPIISSLRKANYTYKCSVQNTTTIDSALFRILVYFPLYSLRHVINLGLKVTEV
jgi:hypothetical protein